MKPNTLGRRRFIASTLTLVAYSSCKKVDINPVDVPTSQTEPANPIPPNQSNNSVEDDYLGQFLETEYGPDLMPNDFSKKIIGYSDKFSYKPGEKVTLYLSGAKNSNQKINLTDQLGNVVFSFSTAIDVQTINPDKPWVNGFAFNKTATVTLPGNLKSGIYYWTDNIPLVCTGTDSAPEIVVVYPTNTIIAYCLSGGKNVYKPQDAVKTSRACVVSTQRYTPPDAIDSQTNSFFQWMMQQNYRVKYISDMDMENYAEIQNAKTLMIVGHSEYWTRKGRQNFDKFVASGRNAFVLSGNTMYFQVRHNLKKNTMICYKSDSHDPLRQTPYSTVLWNTPFLGYPTTSSIGADFDSGGYADRLSNRLDGFKVASENSPLL
ncbi:MAG: hypothetical protein JKY70_06175, partial [Mucilaginibacter sp.]|nr:hypothetical protein [Mucilaginibacter sp.]